MEDSHGEVGGLGWLWGHVVKFGIAGNISLGIYDSGIIFNGGMA